MRYSRLQLRLNIADCVPVIHAFCNSETFTLCIYAIRFKHNLNRLYIVYVKTQSTMFKPYFILHSPNLLLDFASHVIPHLLTKVFEFCHESCCTQNETVDSNPPDPYSCTSRVHLFRRERGYSRVFNIKIFPQKVRDASHVNRNLKKLNGLAILRLY